MLPQETDFPLLSVSSFEFDEASAILYTSDSAYQALFSNPADLSNHQIISSSANLLADATAMLRAPADVSLSLDGQTAYIADISLFSIDLQTGEKSILADDDPDHALPLYNTLSIANDPRNSTVYILDANRQDPDKDGTLFSGVAPALINIDTVDQSRAFAVGQAVITKRKLNSTGGGGFVVDELNDRVLVVGRKQGLAGTVGVIK